MNTGKYITCVLLSFLMLAFIVGACQKDNDIEELIRNSDTVQENAKYINYNITNQSELPGVYVIQITGTQPFNTSLYNWPEEGFDQTTDAITFLSSDEKTISKYTSWDSPYPEERSDYFNKAFADGTFADILAQYLAVKPMSVSKIQYVYFDKIGNPVYPDAGSYTFAEAIEVDSGESGVLSSSVYQKKIIDPKNSGLAADSIVFQETVTFTDNPFDGVFIQVEKEYKTAESTGQLQISGTVKMDHQRAVQGSLTNDDSEYTCKDANGNVSADFNVDGDASDDNDCFGLFDDTKTVLAYSDVNYVRSQTSRTLNSDDKTEEVTHVYYTGEFSSSENARVTDKTEYEDLALWRKKSTVTKVYETNNGSLQFVSQSRKEYEDDCLAKIIKYDIETGSTKLKTSTSVLRDNDDNHIINSIITTNASGEIIYGRYFNYDDQGRKIVESAYDVSNDETQCDYKITFGYSETNGLKSFTKSEYGCTNGSFSDFPENRIINKYDSRGLKVSCQTWAYDESGGITGGSKETWEYDETGFLTRNQQFSVTIESGTVVAEPVDYYVFEKDSNLFRTSKKHVDKSGNLCITDEVDESGSGVDSNHECNSACISDSACYRTSVHTYEEP
jgi:hypothetical protein